MPSMKGMQIISTDIETRKNQLENKFQANSFICDSNQIQVSNVWKLLSLGWPLPDYRWCQADFPEDWYLYHRTPTHFHQT